MKTYQIIEMCSFVIWITVPLVYRKHNNFYFFLFLGGAAIVSILLWDVLSISSLYAWLPFHYLMLIGFNREYFYKNIKIKLLGLIPILIINPFLSYSTIKSFILIFHLIFIIFFVRFFASQLIKNNNFSIFYILMIIYESIMIFRLVASLRDIRLGMEVSYVGSIIQIFIGIVLIIMQLWKNRSDTVTA